MPTIRVDPETRELVRQLAADMGISMTAVMRLAANVYLEEVRSREARQQGWAQRNQSASHRPQDST